MIDPYLPFFLLVSQLDSSIGIDNIVVYPGDMPIIRSGMLRKSHAVDSSMLAQSLRTNELKGIYTPDCRGMSVTKDFYGS